MATPAHGAHTRRRARIALVESGRLLVEYLMAGTVSTAADSHLQPGDLLDVHQRTRLYFALHQAVSAAADHIMQGTSWEEIGAKLDLSAEDAQHQFGHVVQQIVNGSETITCAPPIPGITVVGIPQVAIPSDPDELARLIAELDLYYASHQAPGGGARSGDHEVSRGLPTT